MTTPQTEFEQLFRACWSGESPWEVLADWVLELDDLPHLTASFLYDPLDGNWVRLRVYEPLLLSDNIGFALEEPGLGIGDSHTVKRVDFAREFPYRIQKDIDLLFYILSK